MAQSSILDLMVDLNTVSRRSEAAARLARRLGSETLLILLRDPSLGVLIPAPGMSQTLRGGRSWRDFLKNCPSVGRCEAEVELPMGNQSPALALIYEGTALVMLGARPEDADLTELERVLPLFAALLNAEQCTGLAKAESALALEAANRSQDLADALEMARSEASALNAEFREEHRRKDEFLAMLGHELRNPLAPLVTAIDLIRMHPPGRELPAFLVESMGRQIAQLSRLVEDLLDMSRVSRGRIELRREPLLLADVLQDAYKESRALLDARQHQVFLRGMNLPLTVNADRARLMQIFGNLLNNTAKYTDTGGRIAMTLSCEGESAVVRVTDNGIGIDPENLPRIFELFAQASPALGRAEGGLGIGLTLVRTLVQLHGGSICAESPGVGQGASFIVKLPLMVVPKLERTAKPALSRDKSPSQADSAHILIVDDNRDAADSMAMLLRSKGHQVDVSYDGDAALSMPARSKVDLILLDIGLPGIDGYEVARRLRPQVKHGTQIVALTGYGTEEGRRRSREAGFDAHLVKPVTLDVLDDQIANCVAQREAIPNPA